MRDGRKGGECTMLQVTAGTYKVTQLMTDSQPSLYSTVLPCDRLTLRK